MTGSGRTLGTVTHWDPATGTGLLDLPGLGGGCRVEAAVVEAGGGAHALRTGQVVDVEWVDEPGRGLHATRVRTRSDLETGPGG